MKRKLMYWIPTGLLLLFMAGGGISYLVNPEAAIEGFAELGYPGYTVYFNAIAKILGAIAIVAPVPRVLKEWAYAGYLYILLLALQATAVSMPSMAPAMAIFIAIWALSYWQFRKRIART